MNAVLAIGLGYLAGSIPFAYLAGKLLKGVDLRTVGSGNLGATNVMRVLGWQAGAVVLLLDATKGAVPVLVAPQLAGGVDPQALSLAVGVAAILGHGRPVFLLGKGGGKGVATAAGVIGALAPAALAICVGVFAVVLAGSRMVSLASVTAATVLPFALAATVGVRGALVWVGVAIAGFVVWKHRANLTRIQRGEEPRLSFKRSAP